MKHLPRIFKGGGGNDNVKHIYILNVKLITQVIGEGGGVVKDINKHMYILNVTLITQGYWGGGGVRISINICIL